MTKLNFSSESGSAAGGKTDSAGVPWAGRQFDQSAFSSDDGSAPERLIEALRRFRSRELGEAEVVDAVRDSRFLIPLLAELGGADRATKADQLTLGEHGLLVDKSAELSIVTVAGPDGRNVMPVFTSVAAMKLWNPDARPVPADAVRVALAAAGEHTELVVVDATTATEFVIRRPALKAIATSQPWQPCYHDTAVLRAFVSHVESEPSVLSVVLEGGDPDARLEGPELVVRLELAGGLDETELGELLVRLQLRWSTDETIANRVDSLTIKIGPIHE